MRRTPGDPNAGQVVFQKVCGQCHKIHGQGQEVGPDITVNGRSSFEQLLSNVFDPSLVIGAAYQARTVATNDGRILTGLVAEDSPQRVVLKVQGGKLETIARGRHRSDGNEQAVAHARGSGEAAQAAGAGRSVRVPHARQAADRSRGAAIAGRAHGARDDE